MKKFFILASAAIVALASCSKTQVVYNDAPEEIGFKAITGVMTKTTTFEQSNTLGVFANVNGTDDPYFANALFAYNSTQSAWTGGKYWPIDDALDFTLYAPRVDGATYDESTLVLTIPVDDNSTAQYDYLYGQRRYMNNTSGSGKIATELKHGLSKVTVKVYAGAASVFTVTDIKLNDTVQDGNIVVTYNADGTFKSLGTSSAGDADKDLDFTDATTLITETTALNAQTIGSKYVFPSTQTSFAITYNMGDATGLTAAVNLTGTPAPTWDPGKHYIYTLKFSANEIMFDLPTILDWDGDDVVADKTIQ